MEEYKHGIGFKVGIAASIGVAMIVVIALLASVGVFSGLSGAGPGSSGGLTGAAGSVVIPSDEDGGIVQGDGFTVATVVPGGTWNTMAADVDLSSIRVVKTKDLGDFKDFRIEYECREDVCRDVRIVITLDFENFKKSGYHRWYQCTGSGQTFRLEPGKETIYFQILGACGDYQYTGSSIYKVSLT